MEEKNIENRFSPGQLIWGICLSIAGLGMFFRIPVLIELMKTNPSLERLSPVFAWICFGLIGIVLCTGGIQKIIIQLRAMKQKKPDSK